MGNVQKRENGRWRARYRDPSGRERARHFTRKVDAERWLVSMESTKHRGEWVDPAMSRITVGDWSTRWLPVRADYLRTAAVSGDILPFDVGGKNDS